MREEAGFRKDRGSNARAQGECIDEIRERQSHPKKLSERRIGEERKLRN